MIVQVIFVLFLMCIDNVMKNNAKKELFECPKMTVSVSVYTLCLRKNDTDVTHYRFNPHQPISVIFGRDVAERVCYRMVI